MSLPADTAPTLAADLPEPAPLDADGGIAAAMAALYDDYFTSRDYQRRYPQPNRATLAFLLRHGAAGASRVLDYGCGDGRYALPLLERTAAQVTGYDISHAAIAEFAARVKASPQAARAALRGGDADLLEGTGPYDLVLLLFGVLGHVGSRADRVAVLRRVRRLIAPGGRLILTVPSVFRRRPLELLRAHLARQLGRATGPQREPGNVLFTRTIGNGPHCFFYHLYSVRTLRQELADAGFALRHVSAESVLPEWTVTQYPWLGRLDALLLPLLPADLGYGIRAVAEPGEEA
jgi:SAM-dependent methyltransferase